MGHENQKFWCEDGKKMTYADKCRYLSPATCKHYRACMMAVIQKERIDAREQQRKIVIIPDEIKRI